MLPTRAEAYETLRRTSEALRRSLPDGSMLHTVFLIPCSTRAVACTVHGGVGGDGYVQLFADAAPTMQL